MLKVFFLGLTVVLWVLPVNFAAAHHVLGRPAYSLNEDSNTPPSIQGEAEIGEFSVTYMVYPAFPKPNQPGRLSLYIKRHGDGSSFEGKVKFSAGPDQWLPFGAKAKKLGVQPPDDNVFRQGFRFHQAGDYLVTASFDDKGEIHTLDIPMRVGAPPAIGPLGITVAVLLLVLVGFGLLQRRRAMTGRNRMQ